jgi:uncharacterized protein YjbI with pentapeptide repeats
MSDNETIDPFLTISRQQAISLQFAIEGALPSDHFGITEDKLTISYCIFNDKFDQTSISSKYGNIHFANCIFNKDFTFGNRSIISFFACKFKSNFKLTEKFRGLLLAGCDFTDCAIINAIITDAGLTFAYCTLRNDLIVSIESQSPLIFENINSNGYIYIKQLNIEQSVLLIKITAKLLSFSEIKIIHPELVLSEITVEKLHMVDMHVKKKLKLDDINTDSFNITNVSTLNLVCSSIKSTGLVSISADCIENLMIERHSCAHLYLTGNISKDSHYKLINLDIDKLEFEKIKNDGSLELNQVTVSKSFHLLLSDLKKTDLIHCNMMNAKLIFKNSKITEVFLAGTSFPRRVFNEKEILDEEQARLAYGQLHKAMLNMGDSVNALHFQSGEIAAHYRQLQWFKSFKEFFTKLNLFLNWLSNDFGRSWSRGIVFSFGIAVVFFFLLTISTVEYSFGLPLDYDPNLLGSFFRFINPLRFYETEKIYESAEALKLTPGSYVIDFLARVIIAYGFYQTIQAFRRLGKA